MFGIITQKRCSKCSNTKDVSEFFKCKSSKDGYKSNCKDCSRKYNNKYRETNKDKVLLSHRLYNLFHKDEINNNNKKRYETEPEKRKQIQDNYREKHRDEINRKNREAYKENPDRRKIFDAAYRNKYLDRIREKGREYAKKFRDRDRDKKAHYENKRRSLKKSAKGSFTNQEWIDLCNKYDNKCLCCGEKKKLTRDHVVPLSLGGDNDINNIQPLCLSCNCSKHDRIIDYR
jgi:hypothetical protein